jgi:integrase
MATIVLRASGRWQAKVRRHDAPAISRTFKTKLDADAWARKLESEQERGVWRDSSAAERMTLAQALERYEHERTVHKRGAAQEASVLRILRDEPMAQLTLARIGSHDVAALRDAWKRRGYAAATIRRRMNVLRHVYTIASREWNMSGLQNPVRAVALEPENNARSRRVSDAELDAICAATGSVELSSLIRLAVETAMRRGELCALRWEHVDLHACTAHLPHTKNGHARDVPLTRRAVEVLDMLPRRLDGRVFSMHPDSVTQAFERAAARTGIENVRVHDLRHEATSRLADKLQAHELAKVTGHRDMRMVLRYYHPRATDLAKKLG